MTEPTAPGVTPRGLVYRGDVDTLSVYDFWLRGRVVLEVVVNNVDPDLRIYVAAPGSVTEIDDTVKTDGVLRPTSGQAVKKTFYVPSTTADSVPDGLHEHIASDSIRTYVNPRLAVLLAKVFVPEAPITE
jgi:hypothetical protein